MTATRTYHLDPPLHADADRTYFGPVRFRAKGSPPADPFLLAPETWQQLGEPHAIRVTVEAEDS
jgi:hypothetical protein